MVRCCTISARGAQFSKARNNSVIGDAHAPIKVFSMRSFSYGLLQFGHVQISSPSASLQGTQNKGVQFVAAFSPNPATTVTYLHKSMSRQWLQDLQITSGNVYDRHGSTKLASGANSPMPMRRNRSLRSALTCGGAAEHEHERSRGGHAQGTHTSGTMRWSSESTSSTDLTNSRAGCRNARCEPASAGNSSLWLFW